jgi:hypothetical protein
MLILEKFKNKYHQFGLWLTEQYVIQNLIAKFDCRLKGKKQTILLLNRPGPASSLATGGC